MLPAQMPDSLDTRRDLQRSSCAGREQLVDAATILYPDVACLGEGFVWVEAVYRQEGVLH